MSAYHIHRSTTPLPDSPENSLSETVRETDVARKLEDCTARSLLPSRLIALLEADTAKYAQLFTAVVSAAIVISRTSFRQFKQGPRKGDAELAAKFTFLLMSTHLSCPLGGAICTKRTACRFILIRALLQVSVAKQVAIYDCSHVYQNLACIT